MGRPTSRELVHRAIQAHTAIPSFNIPYLPMMSPVVRALRDTATVGMVTAALVEWKQFSPGSPRELFATFEAYREEPLVRLHLDHIPVIDEDGERVDYLSYLAEALELGYDSIMVDGSRLPLSENIAATRAVVLLAARTEVAVEGELGAVLGHEAGPPPPYEELFASGQGFTDPDEARRFVHETGVDWLSVAIGNIHGAVAAATRNQPKVQARLDLEHLDRLREVTGVPLVLHGGSGIHREYLQEGIRRGIAKVNVGTSIRQAYEAAVGESVEAAQEAVYRVTLWTLEEELQVAGSAAALGICC